MANFTQEFYVTEGLYKVQPVFQDKKKELFNLIYTLDSIDCHCVECDSSSVFQPDDNRPRTRISGMPSHFPQTDDHWEINVEAETLLVTKEFTCSRDARHRLVFHLLLKGGTLQKIGQHPSIRDLNISEIRGFKKILTDKYFLEYCTAIGLHSHGVGIGAFVYLRRIVENFIVKPAHKEATKSDGWDEVEFQKKRMKERIEALKEFLPEYLVKNKIIYSVVSKGIHELTEDECNEYFPVVSSVLNVILTELKEKQETELSKKTLADKLSQIGGEINQ